MVCGFMVVGGGDTPLSPTLEESSGSGIEDKGEDESSAVVCRPGIELLEPVMFVCG